MHAFVSSDYLRVSSLTSCVDKCNEGLDLSDALGLVELASPWWYAYASSSAKERERERGNRSVDRLVQSNLDGREGAPQ